MIGANGEAFLHNPERNATIFWCINREAEPYIYRPPLGQPSSRATPGSCSRSTFTE